MGVKGKRWESIVDNMGKLAKYGTHWKTWEHMENMLTNMWKYSKIEKKTWEAIETTTVLPCKTRIAD